ncbi:MAG: HlyD family type I secretion periplasmic adaptor subunit, partial [Sinobacterium sp.]|nr:HlyD family type I secretion periplasmic adaptor subunit [Sinobacterium sp.]
MKHSYFLQLQQAYRARQVVWLISALLVSVIIWAALSSIDEVVVGEGRLVPASSVQKIQSLDGGVLKSLHVSEGDRVTKGQLLVTLDETRARASYAEAESEQQALRAKRVRLTSELDAVAHEKINVDVIGSIEIDHSNKAMENEVASFYADLKELSGKVEKADQYTVQKTGDLSETLQKIRTIRHSLRLLDDELALTNKAVQSGALSASELRKLERERVNVSGQIDVEKINIGKIKSMIVEAKRQKSLVFDEFQSRIRKELSDTNARLARLVQMLAGLNNQLEQTKLMASMAGTIKSIALPSIGGVIKPGDTVLEVVPLDDKLIVEIRVKPKDVGRLKAGQEAMVKFSAYDFVIYGGVKGKLSHISPDTITDEKGNAFFIAHVIASAEEWKS